MWPWAWGVLLLALVVVGVVLAVRALGPGPERPGGRDRARAVLDERYARGELTTEQYRERLGVLEGG